MQNQVNKRVCSKSTMEVRSNYIHHFFKTHGHNFSFNMNVLDIGSGRCRNLKYFSKFGFKNLNAIDCLKFQEVEEVENLSFYKCNLNESFPSFNKNFDIILCNFIFMFISDWKLLIDEIDKIASLNCYLIFEYNKRDLVFSYKENNPSHMLDCFKMLGWEVLEQKENQRYYRFIIKKKGVGING